jgi:hypothetical protein
MKSQELREDLMTIPDHVDARWIATLGDDQLAKAEAELHGHFRDQETAEKRRAGARYLLLQGPSTLVNAWLRWLLVNNAMRTRGLTVRR